MSTLIRRQDQFHPEHTMSPEVEALWWKVHAYSLDQPAVTDPFSARLAREQRWSATYTQRVIAEYKRFVLLAVTPSDGVTPSEAVDRVWHAHLTYTREYWNTFCGSVLGRPLHHSPGNGDTDDHAKHWRNYTRTLERYAEMFSEPAPSDIWPPVAIRFGVEPSDVPVSSRADLIVSSSSLQSAADAIVLHAYEAAFLAGGAEAVADAVAANLVARGSLALQDGVVTQRQLFCALHPLERAAYSQVRHHQGPMQLTELRRFVIANTGDISKRLQGLGLSKSAGTGAVFTLAWLVPALALLNAGVGWAVAGGIVGLIIASSCCDREVGASALGRAALANFKRNHESFIDEYPAASEVVDGGHLPAVVALAGLKGLRRFELGDLADALTLARLQTAPESCNTCGGGCGCG